MSEKELREGAIQTSLDGSWVCVFCLQHSGESRGDIEHSEDCPLADDPDVVEVLRWFKAQAIWGEEHGSVTAGHWADMCNAMISRFSKEFHIRLTDDGWEWTER